MSVFLETERWRRRLRLWNTGTVVETRTAAPLCSTCSLTTSTPFWGTSRNAALRPRAPPARSRSAPLWRKLNSSCVDRSLNSAHTATFTTRHSHKRSYIHKTTADTLPWTQLIWSAELKDCIWGWRKGAITETELVKYTQTYDTAAATNGNMVAPCGLFSAAVLWRNFSLDCNLLWQSHRGLKMTLGKMILQTSVKISIFLQDRYNPIAHGYFDVYFCVAVGALSVGILPQQHRWWWPCGLSFFFFFPSLSLTSLSLFFFFFFAVVVKGRKQIQASHQAL